MNTIKEVKESKKYTIKDVYGDEMVISFVKGTYQNNKNLYVGAIFHENGCTGHYCDVTVNLDTICEENRAYINTNNLDDSILQLLCDEDMILFTERVKISGYCIYPEAIFFSEFLNDLEEV